MARILILFAHPALEKSRIHRRLVQTWSNLPGITFHDLYEAYPNFQVDVPHEQALLIDHDLIIFQHPFYWYSTPAMLKQWQDLVLEHGWAYGSKGKALRDKRFFNLITAGGSAQAYRREGYNRFTIRELLSPIEQTVYLCGMIYLPPYVIHSTHRMLEADIEVTAERYQLLLTLLQEDKIDSDKLRQRETLNEALEDALDEGVTA